MTNMQNGFGSVANDFFLKKKKEDELDHIMMNGKCQIGNYTRTKLGIIAVSTFGWVPSSGAELESAWASKLVYIEK